MTNRDKQLVLHGMLAAVNTFKQVNTPMMSLGELAIHIAGYADMLAAAWGVDQHTAGRMDKAGKLPRSIIFNGVHLYKRQEIEQWEKELLTELKNRHNNNKRK